MNTSVWVLILLIKMYKAGGPAMYEFTTEERCEAAKQAIVEEFDSGFITIQAICVPK